MWCRVDIVLTDVSEERIASIFIVEERKKKKSASEPAASPPLLSSSVASEEWLRGLPGHSSSTTAVCITT
jgi:hypothetical protein